MRSNDFLSKDGLIIIKIVEREDGFYSLQRFEKKYDDEEGCEYTVRIFPDPVGVFGDISSATKEANRLIVAESSEDE